MTKEYALITGASSGIGFELAKLLAADGHDLILLARDAARLAERAEFLQATYRVGARVIPADLSDPAAPQKIFDTLARDGRAVSILINNAGFGIYGAFRQTDLAGELSLMQVNMNALVALTKLFMKPMIDSKQGRIMNVASTVSFQPGPGLSIYSASKAFVHSFTCALAVELEGTGVTVTSLCPGGTETEFQRRAGMERAGTFNSPLAKPMSAAAVAEEGYRALMRGKPVVVAGLKNKLMVAVSRRLPMLWPARLAARINRDR